MAAWARKVARDPNATTPADIQALRDAGLDDGQIFAITAFVALRLAFSTINDALGAQPDAELAQSLPPRGPRGRDLRPAGSSSAGLCPTSSLVSRGPPGKSKAARSPVPTHCPMPARTIMIGVGMTVGSSETMQAWVVSQPGPIESSPLRYVEKPVPAQPPANCWCRCLACVCRTDPRRMGSPCAPTWVGAPPQSGTAAPPPPGRTGRRAARLRAARPTGPRRW